MALLIVVIVVIAFIGCLLFIQGVSLKERERNDKDQIAFLSEKCNKDKK